MTFFMSLLYKGFNSLKDNEQVSIFHVLIVQISSLLPNFSRVRMHEIFFFLFTFKHFACPYCTKDLMITIMQIFIVANNSSKGNRQVSIFHVLIVQISSLLPNVSRVRMHEILSFLSPFFSG